MSMPKSFGWTPLYSAAHRVRSNASRLERGGASINTPTAYGYTLHRIGAILKSCDYYWNMERISVHVTWVAPRLISHQEEGGERL